MAKSLSWNAAIVKVLRSSEDALTPIEIADRIVAEDLRDSYGATPQATVAVIISKSMTSLGEKSPFVRVGRGEYTARGQDKSKTTTQTRSREQGVVGEDASAIQQDKELTPAGGVRALGMYWTRDAVLWAREPKLLGKQQIGADPVDVSGQVGVYLLYDGREAIYVGRSIDRPLGIRLYEHTQDRLRARWNRFSWFGLREVRENGTLNKEIPDTNSEDLIRAMEAILIEAVEPRQNRKRGDDFSGIEFIQEIDPEIRRQQELRVLENMKRGL